MGLVVVGKTGNIYGAALKIEFFSVKYVLSAAACYEIYLVVFVPMKLFAFYPKLFNNRSLLSANELKSRFLMGQGGISLFRDIV